MKVANFKYNLLAAVIFVVYLLLGAGIFFAIEKDAEEPLDAKLVFMMKAVSEKQIKGIQMGMTKAVPQVIEAYKAQTKKTEFDDEDVKRIAAMALQKVLEQVKQMMAQKTGTKSGNPQAEKHSANGGVEAKTENMSENPSYNSVPDEEARVKRQAEENNATEVTTTTTVTPTPPAPTQTEEHADHKSGFGSFVFLALTSISTIGYGNIVPKTFGGRIFFMLYTAFGVPIFLLMVLTTAIANRRMAIFVHSKLLQILKKETLGTFAKNVSRLLVVFVFVFLVLILMCAAIFQHVEGWEYVDALYFEFSTLFTVGFGDLYPGMMLGLGDPREVSKALRGVYMVFVFSYMIMGISWICTLAMLSYDCFTTKHQTKEISQANGVSTPPKVKLEKEEEKNEDVEKTEEPLLDETEKLEEKELEEIKSEHADNSV